MVDFFRAAEIGDQVCVWMEDDPNLSAIVAAWPELPEAIRAGILAMVHAATTKDRPSINARTLSGPRRK